MVEEKDKKEKKEVNPEPKEPEKPEVPEIVPPERKVEIEKPPVPEAPPKAPPPEVAPPALPLKPPAPPPRPPKSETLVKIEKVLEEDLKEVYFKMPPEAQKEFKEKGEETASKIEKFIETGKVAAKKILRLIRDWLKLIPGVNKFFLEQEAKIKTDKIIALAEKKKAE